MYSWSELLSESQKHITDNEPNGSIIFLREKKSQYLRELSEKTGRNTILYFSTFLHKSKNPDVIINDKDMELSILN